MYTFIGLITQVPPLERVGMKNTPKAQIIIHKKNEDGEQSKEGVVVTFFASRADIISIGRYRVGEEVEITFGLAANEYNGRRYQNVEGIEIRRMKEEEERVELYF